MIDQAPFYFGNAATDQVRGSGWFIGQFVAPELGLRHQTDVEVKWGLHPDGDKRDNHAKDEVNQPCQENRCACCRVFTSVNFRYPMYMFYHFDLLC